MKFVSLFSGIGGFDLGFEQAGLMCVLQVEIDPHCLNVLERRWPNVKRVEDVHNVKMFSDTVDVVCGGFPCQDLSVAGRRSGLAGKQSRLWFQFLRVIEINHPRWVVIENVPGLLSSQGGKDFALLLRGLVECGYGVAWRILDAQYFGVAQRRRRVFVVGHLGDGRAAQVLFEREGLSGNTPPSREAGQRIANTLRGGSAGGSSHGKQSGSDQATMIIGTLSAKAGRTNRPAENADELDFRIAAPLRAGRQIADSHGDQGNVVLAHSLSCHHGRNDGESNYIATVAAPLTSSMAMGAGVNDGKKGKPQNLVLALQMNYIRKERIGEQAGSIQAQPGDAQFNGVWDRAMGVRRLTPVECERLQGFPDRWTAEGTDGLQSDSVRYRQLGNAVCVPVTRWIGQQLQDTLST